MLTRSLQNGNLNIGSVSNLSHFPAAATAAVITVAAVTDRRHIVHAILASYSATPTGGRLTVKSASTVLVDLDLAIAELVEINNPIVAEYGEELEIRLYSGAGTVVGKLNALVTTEA